MKDFSKKLMYRTVWLKDVADVVRFSFIARSSICYLDLALCQYSVLNNRKTCECCALDLSNSFINTEEKCRKFFTHSRSLFYALHLDLPKGRECSLRNVPISVTDAYCISSCPHIGEIVHCCGFGISILSDFIEATSSNKYLKILKWLFQFKNFPLLSNLNIRIVDKFIDCFYPEITDSVIFKDFIMQFNFLEWMTSYENPEILEYLFYYARHYGRKDLERRIHLFDAIEDLSTVNRFLNIGPILKYISFQRFSYTALCKHFHEISLERPNLEHNIFGIRRWLKLERLHHMLQIIFMHTKSREYHYTEDVSEALRLMWCSVPEPYISFGEMKRAFEEVFSAEELENIYDFYSRVVGEFNESVQPRLLQHLCRPVIRNALEENQVWIPEGIRQTGLPKSMQSFLNLEFIPSKK